VVEKFIQSEQTTLVSGGIQAALKDFVVTLPLAPTLTGELETSLATFPVDDLELNAAQHMNTGDATLAEEMYQALHALGADKRVSAETWNDVCWLGSLWGQAQKVLDICDLAVSLDPSNASIRDSRGLALAITGKTAEAIADFQVLVDWCKQNGCSDTLGSQREQWIAALKSGQNPFNEQLLQSLRNQ
jgi:tetratricopeptide (TPR) repeat protein